MVVQTDVYCPSRVFSCSKELLFTWRDIIGWCLLLTDWWRPVKWYFPHHGGKRFWFATPYHRRPVSGHPVIVMSVDHKYFVLNCFPGELRWWRLMFCGFNFPTTTPLRRKARRPSHEFDAAFCEQSVWCGEKLPARPASAFVDAVDVNRRTKSRQKLPLRSSTDINFDQWCWQILTLLKIICVWRILEIGPLTITTSWRTQTKANGHPWRLLAQF